MSNLADNRGPFHDKDNKGPSNMKRNFPMENRGRRPTDGNNSDRGVMNFGRSGYRGTRIYVGNLPPNLQSCVLRDKFEKYGKITSIESYHNCAFVQFEKEEDAKAAISAEMFCTIKGQIINVNLAVESQSADSSGRNERFNMREKEPWGNPGMPNRDRSPLRETFNRAGPLGKNGAEMENREFFDNSNKWNGPPNVNQRLQQPPAQQQQQPPQQGPMGNQYYDEYRDNRSREANNWTRPPFNDNPSSTNNAPPQRPAFDASLMITSPQLRDYADHLKRRLENFNMSAEICVISEDCPQMNFVEEKARQGVLYVIIICPQNEVYNSLTLHIFPGTPQEHRNMPLADAMNLVARNFERYLQQMKEDNNSSKPEPTQAFDPPPFEIRYLLDLLADSRYLSIEELDKVLLYVSNRKKKMMEMNMQSPASEGSSGFRAEEDKRRIDSNILLQHPNLKKDTDFQSKILSMITSNTAGDNSADEQSSSKLNPLLCTKSDAPICNMEDLPPEFFANPSNVKTFINFENPTVKRALDNLMQSGPNILENITAVAKGLSLPQRSDNLPFDEMKNHPRFPTNNSGPSSMDRHVSQWGPQQASQMPNMDMNQNLASRPNPSSVGISNCY